MNPMTLPQNVADAVKLQDQSAEDSPYDESAWQTIRAHLMSQEAEIDELVRALTMCTDRAKRAESRLAAANALLRNVVLKHTGEDRDGCGMSNAEIAAIQSHLQGAGDE